MTMSSNKNTLPVNYGAINVKKVYAFATRSMFITFDNKVFIGEKSFSMIPLSEFEFLCQLERQIKTISMGSEHCIIQDSKN